MGRVATRDSIARYEKLIAPLHLGVVEGLLIKMPRDTGDTTQTSSTLTSSRASALDTQLEEAILTVKSKHLRSTLLAVCRNVPQAAAVAQRRLLVESGECRIHVECRTPNLNYDRICFE